MSRPLLALLVLLAVPVLPLAATAQPAESATAGEKLDWFWSQIVAQEGIEPAPSATTKVGRIARSGRNILRLRAVFKAMEEGRDLIEANRDKPIHGRPARLSKVRFRALVPTTGGFADGTELLARFSVGIPSPDRHLPGVALKAFRDGEASVNFLAMSSLEGQGADPNPFLQSPSNALTEPRTTTGKIASRAFELFSGNDEAWLPVEHFGRVDGKAPFEVRLVPTEVAMELGRGGGSYEQRLDRVRIGTPIYEVYARFGNDESRLIRIGTLETSSRMVRSAFGSKIVFGHKSARTTGARWKNRAVQVGRLLTRRPGPRLRHGPAHPPAAPAALTRSR